MGYRWYDARSLPVRFPFGHGLSYATFEIGAPRVSADDVLPRLGTLTVEVDVTNTSDRAGSEVVQLYVEPPPSELVRPPRELRAFAKVTLGAGRDDDRRARARPTAPSPTGTRATRAGSPCSRAPRSPP